MAGRTAYTDDTKAKVYAVLAANDGNIKRTARETHIPENTVRRWKEQFKLNPPPTDLVDKAVNAFLTTAEYVRDYALETLIAKIPMAKPSELITIVGVLDDKITRTKGLATSRVEAVVKLPSADDLRSILGPAVQAAIDSANTRQEEIIDGQIIEEAEIRTLPA